MERISHAPRIERSERRGLGAALRSVSSRPPPVGESLEELPALEVVKVNPDATWRGDLSGGLAAAVIALPLAVAFGVATFAPLGPEYAPLGALAGLTAAVVGGFMASLLGGTPALVTGPTGPMTVVMTAVVAYLVGAVPEVGSPAARIAVILTLTFFTVFLGGLVQVVVGLLNVGRLVRYIPYPVVAGFMNGIAVVILLGQVRPFLGASPTASYVAAMVEVHATWPTVLIGALTAAVVAFTPRFTRRVPAALAGLGVGALAYYAAALIGLDVGPVVGAIPSALPTPSQAAGFVSLLGAPELLSIVPMLIAPALALGILGTIDTLLTSVVADVVTNTHHDSRREILGQGLGNMASSIFGGLAGAGTTVATLVSVHAGGRTRRAGMTQSMVLLAVVLVAAPLAGRIPMVVLAAILIVTAVRMIDGWSRQLLVKLFGHARSRRALLVNLGIVLLVTVVTVAVDLMVAVAVGLVIASLLFVSKMGKHVVRRVRDGAQRHSARERSREERDELRRQRRRIAVLELDGALFFGSTGGLVDIVEHHMHEVDYFILDAQHLSEIDGTGAKALQQLHDTLEREGKELAVSHIGAKSPWWGFLGDMGDIDVLGADHFFEDTDAALEWAEDAILSECEGLRRLPERVSFHEMHVVQHLEPDERERLRARLETIEFRPGDALIERGAEDRRLVIPFEGTLGVFVWNDDEQRYRRITTLEPGVIVGEEAFLEGLPHGARVCAHSHGRAYVLHLSAFEELSRDDPTLTMKLLFNIGRELSARLRKTSELVAALDH